MDGSCAFFYTGIVVVLNAVWLLWYFHVLISFIAEIKFIPIDMHMVLCDVFSHIVWSYVIAIGIFAWIPDK